MSPLSFFRKIPTTLEINGPILSFVDNQLSSVSVCDGGIATFTSGIATATFPTQTPPNLAENTGIITYRWYEVGVGQLSDGSNITGTGTTILTLSNLSSPEDDNRQFFIRADYIPSAYAIGKSTGNAINEIFDSEIVGITVYPSIFIENQPIEQTVAQGSSAIFDTSASTTDGSSVGYQWTANGVELSDGVTIVPTLSSQSTTTTQSASGFNGSGIYLDLTSLSGSVSVTISTSEESGIFHYINIPGVDNIPENAGSRTYTLEGGRIYGPCNAPNGNLYIGSETPVGGISTLVVEEGGDDWNDMILTVSKGYFRRLTSAPTVTVSQVQSTSLVNAEVTVSGSKTSTLTLSSNVIGIQTVRSIITHPFSCDSPTLTNIVNFNVVSARSIINFEEYSDGGTSIIRTGSKNIFESSLVLTPSSTQNSIIAIYSPERPLRVRITLAANVGASKGGYPGGEGGISVFEYTLLQNTEYVCKIGPYNGALAVFYDRATAAVVVGGGGGAGTSGRGGHGGGIGIAGENGVGSRAGIGGQTTPEGTLPVLGYFAGGSFTTRNLSAITGGRVSGCTVGSQRIYLPCDDVGIGGFYNASDQRLSGSASILRGYKAGLAHRANGGNAASSSDGVGGSGAYGGNGGGGNGSGAGGGSGYSNGVATIVRTQLGGNTQLGYAIIELV